MAKKIAKNFSRFLEINSFRVISEALNFSWERVPPPTDNMQIISPPNLKYTSLSLLEVGWIDVEGRWNDAKRTSCSVSFFETLLKSL